jgi:mono/diheme cytochrome c family protein
MSDIMLLGLFDNVESTVDVIDEVRQLGVDDDQVTVMSNVPYSPEVFGRKTPRHWYLPFRLGGALIGALLATFITVGTPALYPIHVGAQELVPVPPSAIIYFEFIALFTMVGTFVGFLLQNRFPILVRQMYDERITDGYIGVQVQAATSVADKVVRVFEAHRARVVKREDAAAFKPQGIRHLLFWGGVGTGGLFALIIPLLLTYDIVRVPWIDIMKDTVAVGHQEGPRRAAPPDALPIQGPRLISGQPATEPLPATADSIARGQALFAIHCAICHGEQADGQGLLSKYFVEDPALFPRGVPALAGRDLPGSAIFVTVTNGIIGTNPDTGQEMYRMPRLAENLSAGETWDVVNYINSLGAGAGE